VKPSVSGPTDWFSNVATTIHPDVDSLPIIDLLPRATSEKLEDRLAVAQELRQACIDVGFFYLRNHGIEEELVDGVFDEAKRFFALPMAEKEKISVNRSTSYSGYEPFFQTKYESTSRGDNHEGFNFNYEPSFDPEGEREVANHDTKDAFVNNWPNGLPGFKETVLAYYSPLLTLSRLLTRIFALSLGLEENYFDPVVTTPGGIMRLLHYPPQELSTDIGIGAHTDFEMFTILATDDIPALQVRNRQGNWIQAIPPMPGCFIVNVADFFQRLTNDLYISTPHRVKNEHPGPDGKLRERYSIPFFFSINYDALVDTLPTCIDESRPKKYEPITAGNYVAARLSNAKQ